MKGEKQRGMGRGEENKEVESLPSSLIVNTVMIDLFLLSLHRSFAACFLGICDCDCDCD